MSSSRALSPQFKRHKMSQAVPSYSGRLSVVWSWLYICAQSSLRTHLLCQQAIGVQDDAGAELWPAAHKQAML